MATAQPQGQLRPPTSQAPIKKHICDICHKGFDAKAKQRQHRKAAHPQPTAEPVPTTTRAVANTKPAQKPKPKPSTKQASGAVLAVPKQTSSASRAPPAAKLATMTKPVSKNEPAKKDPAKAPERPAAVEHDQTSQAAMTAKATVAANTLDESESQLVVGLDTPHRGNEYTKLSPVEQGTIQRKLLDLCHSKERLEKEGYAFADFPLPTGSPRPADLPVPVAATAVTAIVIDCEMAGTVDDDNELIHITIIDFFTGRVLLDQLVNPTRPIADWRTAITGIDAAMMQTAVQNNAALDGHEAACAELWEIADKNSPNTILIGQSLQKDLTVLHTTPHATKVIDTAILTAEAILGAKKSIKMRKRWGLKELCESLFGIEIRRADGPSSSNEEQEVVAHDALEDVLATREVVLSRLLIPDEFNRWAQQMGKDFSKKKKQPKKKKKKKHSHGYECGCDDDDEVLRWEDVVDWDTWPKSPPSSP